MDIFHYHRVIGYIPVSPEDSGCIGKKVDIFHWPEKIFKTYRTVPQKKTMGFFYFLGSEDILQWPKEELALPCIIHMYEGISPSTRGGGGAPRVRGFDTVVVPEY
jgi:hypothetical protein